jgi:S1-C subfamily serine protease
MTNEHSQTLSNFSSSLTELVKATAPSVVSIAGRRTQASGFVWKPGVIVTADEALHGSGPFSVTMAGGKTREAELRGRDPSTDIAVLKLDVDAGVPARLVPQLPSSGALALAIGSVQGDTLSAMGSVARTGEAWQSLRGGDIDARIELDLRLRRQMQGGLVIDVSGVVFGMAVFGPRRRTLVIPATTIDRVASRILEHGHIARGYLGLGLQTVKVQGEETRGSIIVNVDPDGPGAAAGLRQGDVLVSWNGVPASEAEPLSKALGPSSVGKTVEFGVRRAGEAQTMRVTIGERPAA